MKQPEDFNPPEEMHEQEESFAEIEQYLSQALRRVDAPDGFVERTMARAKVVAMPRRARFWASGAIAAMLLAGVFVGGRVHEQREQQRAELAQQKFETGMRITDQALDQARLQLQQAGVQVGD